MRKAFLIAILVTVAARAIRAQDAPLLTRLVVAVGDSAGRRISDANVTVIRGLRDTIGTGQSDDAGVKSFLLARGAQPYQVVIRKIGFVRVDRFIVAKTDSLVATFRLVPVPQALATVKITEKEDVVRKSYFIDADAIANSERPLIDASDILIKLRPDMIYTRAKGVRDCGLQNIWVNGKLVFREYPPMNMSTSLTRRMPGKAAPSDPPHQISEMARLRASKGGSDAAAIGAARLTVLEEIKPEHIAEISFKDCFDKSMPGNFAKNALYIVLKPGIKYELGIGSYAIDGGRSSR